MRTIYLDYNATTPLDPQVFQDMLPALKEAWGNPSSIHRLGQGARALLDDARDRAAKVLVCKPSEVIFTSGGTEGANMAIFGAARLLKQKGRHIISSSIEHHAVLHSCEYLAKKEGFDLSVLPVDGEGVVSVEDLRRSLRPDTILVSVMAANNEIGTIQPVAELGTLCRSRGVVFHTDAVQWFGKEPFESICQFNADLVSICAHKFHGPKGAGALFAKSPLRPDPILFGGGHENERRAGTENLAAILGLVSAMERFVRQPVFDREKLEPLTSQLIRLAEQSEGVRIAGARSKRLVNTVAFLVNGADSMALLAGLDMEGICASSGSACGSGSLEPSHVIKALGPSAGLAGSLIRFSLGRESTQEEVNAVGRVLPGIISRARGRKS